MDAAFDVSPQVVGTTLNNIPVLPMDSLEDYVKVHKIDVVVLTVPKAAVQDIVDRLTQLGIRGFWNFTNVELSTEVPGVFFEDVHFVDTLLTLSYRISRG